MKSDKDELLQVKLWLSCIELVEIKLKPQIHKFGNIETFRKRTIPPLLLVSNTFATYIINNFQPLIWKQVGTMSTM